jgi:hypothetical protein
MDPRFELLKDVGFSDEFINCLTNYNPSEFQIINSVTDLNFPESIDTTELFNLEQREIATTDITINPSA